MLEHEPCRGRSLSHSLEPASPRAFRRYQPGVAANGYPLGGQLRDDLQTRRAIHGVSAGLDSAMSGSYVVVERAELAVQQPDEHEAVAGGLTHAGVPDRLLDREQLDAGR